MLVITDPTPGSDQLDPVRRALEGGELVVVPTDTVYGLAALATDEAAVARLFVVKQRPATQQVAVAFESVHAMREALPWMGAKASWAAQALLPGPWTLVIDNPEGVLPWLTGGEPGPLGVRVPAGSLELPPIAATSANRSGEPTVERVQDLTPDLVEHLSCAVDRGVLPRASESTVLDLVAWERGEGDIRVLRDTAGRAGQALAALSEPPPRSSP